MDPYGTYVEALHYKVIIPARFKYENPPPVQFDTPDASFRLAEGELVVTLKRDYSTTPEAQVVVAATLEAWEALADLQYTYGEFRFTFDREEMAFRNPPPPGIIVGTAHIRLEGMTTNLIGTVTPPTRRAYPEPPLEFALTPDIVTMRDRLVGSISGREPLPSVAYFCLTVIESIGGPGSGARTRAAKTLVVDVPVLKKLGELSSRYGGAAAGRKASSIKPLTDIQTHWLREALHKLIVRVGQHAAGAPLTLITMADLPPGV
jgi:hypothetical protein